MAFASLRNLLPGAARRAGITRDLAVTNALRAAQEALAHVFGDGYARFADVVSVRRGGALVVACRSPAVAQTIRLHEREVLTTVRTAAPTLAIVHLTLVPRDAGDLRSHGVDGA